MGLRTKDLFSLLLLCFILGGGLFLVRLGTHQATPPRGTVFDTPPAPSRPIVSAAPTATAKDVPGTIYVHVSGEVNNPGVYSVPAGSRLFQLLEIAGGTTRYARMDNLNLARTIQDGERVIVQGRPPLESSPRKTIASKDLLPYAAERSANEPLLKNNTPPANSTGVLKQDIPTVNINTATAEELQKIPRIGPRTAAAIITYRDSRNGFRSLEELREVPRIGPKTFNAIKPFLRLN